MTFTVVVEEGAEADVRSIAAYLAEHYSHRVAGEFVATALERIESLERFPLRGPIPREVEVIGRVQYRQILFGRYRIFYRVDAGRVTIVLVADGRRDMLALLRDRLLHRDAPA